MAEELAERVAFLEREMRRFHYLLDATEKRTDTQVREVSTHLIEQDKNLQDFRESVDKRFDNMDKRFESIDKRFEHVYGQLADINANIIEVRNVLATLVAKLEKS